MKIRNFYNLTFKEVRHGLIVFQDNVSEFNNQIFLKGETITEWPLDATVYVEGKEPTDYLFYPMSPWIIVSRNVQLSLLNANIQGIQFLPIRVEHKIGFGFSGYAILNILKIYTALDYEHSEWLTPEREHVRFPELNIWKIALKYNAIVGSDIFRLAEVITEVYVSEFFIKTLKQSNATVGFDFIRTKMIG